MKIVIVSGGFDPIHRGHLDYLREAAALGDQLWVFVNSDEWLTRKKGRPFQDWKTRASIVRDLRYVSAVIKPIDDDDTVCLDLRETVRRFGGNGRAHFIFAKGGDRVSGNTPEEQLCKELGIEIVFGVGGFEKQNSSSKILKDWEDGHLQSHS